MSGAQIIEIPEWKKYNKIEKSIESNLYFRKFSKKFGAKKIIRIINEIFIGVIEENIKKLAQQPKHTIAYIIISFDDTCTSWGARDVSQGVNIYLPAQPARVSIEISGLHQCSLAKYQAIVS